MAEAVGILFSTRVSADCPATNLFAGNVVNATTKRWKRPATTDADGAEQMPASISKQCRRKLVVIPEDLLIWVKTLKTGKLW